MMRKEFRVASSNGMSSYAVVFIRNGDQLYVTCDCKAGALGQACRHKEGLINGDRGLLRVDEDMSEVLKWVQESQVGRAAERLRDAEAGIKIAQTAVKSAKKELADLVNPRQVR